jgi:hypothetical protein
VEPLLVVHLFPGTVDLLTIELSGQESRLINAGPTLQVHSDCIVPGRLRHEREIDALWNELSKGARLLWSSVNIRVAVFLIFESLKMDV